MEVTINNKTIHVPESWNDLPLKSQVYCYQIIMSNTGGLFDSNEMVPFIRIELAKHLLGIDNDFMEQWEADCKTAFKEDGDVIFQSELKALISICDFLLEPIATEDEEEEPINYQINLGLTKIPWDKLKFKDEKKKRKAYHGPTNELANLTIYELGTTFTLFESFLKAENEEDSDELATELIATIYREPKPPTKKNIRSNYQGDIRLPYLNHETTVERRAKHMKQLPKPVKNLIIFWFASCRQHIVNTYDKVFTTEDKNTGPDYGWGGVLLSLADGLVHLDTIAKQPYANALTYLSYLEDQRQAQELDALFAGHGKNF